MARAYPHSDYADTPRKANGGEWQALRGELVALLDQVESRFARPAGDESALGGLSQRVRYLRDQVEAPEPALRRREALRTVKRAVDRFSPRDDRHDDDDDALTSAIAEIRSRQGAASISALDRRPSETPEFRELSGLVHGISDRLGRLEGDLRQQRGNSTQVMEVASQVEQLTQVVELLAGAVGETGQVKRLEAQIAGLGAMIEKGAQVDLGAINARLDDVSATVGKLAELQAQQMEREIVRQERDDAAPKGKGVAKLEPVMHAIEDSVRSVYDRIDAIEKSLALSSGDFERLTSEMAAFTQAMKDQTGSPDILVDRVEALVARMDGVDSGNGDVLALKDEIVGLQQAVLQGMEPRFVRIESRIEALSDRMAPVDTSAVEGQLKQLMSRMDEAGEQLDGLARLYHDASERSDFESLATMVAERTSDAVTRKAPAPVAMFGPESLKSIEDRISTLVRSVNKQPDIETLADIVAEKTSLAVAQARGPASGMDGTSMDALEKRMTALLNTAGRDTAERLTRLEAALASRAAPAATPTAPAAAMAAPIVAREEVEPFQMPQDDGLRLDNILSRLSSGPSDAMPDNPAEEAPLIDKGFKDIPARPAVVSAPVARNIPAEKKPEEPGRMQFDPNLVERPPRPQSSFALSEKEPFAPAMAAAAAPAVETPVSNTSTFVAAARRAQRARQEQTVVDTPASSLISRALARVRPAAKTEAQDELAPVAEAPVEKPAALKKSRRAPIIAADEPMADTTAEDDIEAIDAGQPGFLQRHRRPLLLAAALVAVSLLTLNLVLQRTVGQRSATMPVAEAAPEAVAPVNPAPSDDQSLVAPRIIDMIDATTVGSINPAPASFSRDPIAPPMPALLSAPSAEERLALASTGLTAEPVAEAVVASFDLPAEGVGPLELREAAAGGDPRAQFEVAAIFTEGRAVPQDLEEAARWYERSAAQGFAPAQYRLGNLFEAGTGVEKDLEKARLWYQRAAEAGNRMAMHNLAALYAGGLLGEQQFEAAAQWFSEAAAFGMTDSQFNLGMLYARGLGVDQDFEQSYKWFSLAAMSGDKDAAQARDDIAKSLTAEAVSRLGNEISAWTIKPVALDVNFAPIGTWMAEFNPGDAIVARDVTTRVQQALNKLGFDVGKPDGVAGRKTAEAIRAFERGTGMTESGVINPRLLAVLGSQPV
jgi:localization factor PodJL